MAVSVMPFSPVHSKWLQAENNFSLILLQKSNIFATTKQIILL